MARSREDRKTALDYDGSDPIVELPTELVEQIDAALLAHTTTSYGKVARIVGLAMKSIPHAPEAANEVFYSRRIAHLVKNRQLESQGDLRRMRFSEVRVHRPPFSAAELEALIAQRAYFKLGTMYWQGEGVAPDYAEALRWYKLGAERGDVWSQANLGRFYMFGHGVPQDYKEAYFWFCLAIYGSPSLKQAHTYWRSQVAGKLTSAERQRLRRRAASWRPRNGQPKMD